MPTPDSGPVAPSVVALSTTSTAPEPAAVGVGLPPPLEPPTSVSANAEPAPTVQVPPLASLAANAEPAPTVQVPPLAGPAAKAAIVASVPPSTARVPLPLLTRPYSSAPVRPIAPPQGGVNPPLHSSIHHPPASHAAPSLLETARHMESANVARMNDMNELRGAAPHSGRGHPAPACTGGSTTRGGEFSRVGVRVCVCVCVRVCVLILSFDLR
jgi:hypothetical protein